MKRKNNNWSYSLYLFYFGIVVFLFAIACATSLFIYRGAHGVLPLGVFALFYGYWIFGLCLLSHFIKREKQWLRNRKYYFETM